MNQTPFSDAALDALFARAREARPDTARAEYGFETRLLAQLRLRRPIESAWGALSWRMMPFFAALVLVLALWHAQVVAETGESQQIDYLANADAGDAAVNLN
jgi:hypothetical protein